MAKRKLSESDRSAIRTDISKKLAKSESQADILKALSAKYKISPETVRWYLKSANGARQVSNGSRKHARVKRAAAPRTARKRRSASRISQQPSVGISGLRKYVGQLAAIARRQLKLEKIERQVKAGIATLRNKAAAVKRAIARVAAR